MRLLSGRRLVRTIRRCSAREGVSTVAEHGREHDNHQCWFTSAAKASPGRLRSSFRTYDREHTQLSCQDSLRWHVAVEPLIHCPSFLA
jgi:hypothetical protein